MWSLLQLGWPLATHPPALANSREDMEVVSYPALDRAKLRFLQRQVRRLTASLPRESEDLLPRRTTTPTCQEEGGTSFASGTATAATEVPSALTSLRDAPKRDESEFKRATDLLAVFCLDLDRDLAAIDSEVQTVGTSIRDEHQRLLSTLKSAVPSAIEATCARKRPRRCSRVHIQRRPRPRIKLVVIPRSNASADLRERRSAAHETPQDLTMESAPIIQSQFRRRLYRSLYQGGHAHFERVCAFRRRSALGRTWKAWLHATRERKKARLRRLELVLQRLEQKSGEWRRVKAPLIMASDGKYGAAKQFSTFTSRLRVFRAWLSIVVASHLSSESEQPQ